MGIRLDKETNTWTAFYSKRHPITRQSRGLRRKGIKTEAEAKRVEKELAITIDRKFHEAVVPKWESFVGEFSNHSRNRGLTERTIYDYAVCLKAHTFEPWGQRTIDSISTDEIRVLVQKLDRSPSHRQNLLKFVRAVFGYAVERGIIQRNPVPTMKFQHGLKIKRVLTEQQVRLFLSKAKELDWEWYPHWTLATYLGARNGELYALTWDKVNFETRKVLIDCSWNNKDGFKSTKSGDDRLVDLNEEELIPFLKQLKLRTGGSQYVLPRSRKWDKGEQARELRLFLKGIGLPEIRFHDLRATWATLLLSKGVSAAKVMAMGGWKDYKTMVIYMRKAGVDIHGATNVLSLHNPSLEPGKVLQFGVGGES